MTNKFNVGDKVVCIRSYYDFTEGKEYKIHHADEQTIILIDDVVEQNQWSVDGFEKYFKVVPTKNQRITALEETVAKQGEEIHELKLIVAQIRKPSIVVEEALANDIIEFEGKQYKKVDREAREGDVVIFTKIPRVDNTTNDVQDDKPYKVQLDFEDRTVIKDDDGYELYVYGGGVLEGTPETVDVYELIVEDKQEILPPAPKTQNQLRAEIIEKAKGFVDRHLTPNSVIEEWNKRGAIKGFIDSRKDTCGIPYLTVDKEKRKVTFVARGIETKNLLIKSVAQCHPSDVFNEHIGKAIALGRVLGLDVSEFEQAVQPNEVVKGHVVETFRGNGMYHNTFEVGSVTRKRKIELREVGETYNLSFTPFETECGDRIINDTNAQYGGVE